MSAWSEGWPAPAKINRFLHIVGRRADGYHLLETVFQFLEHGDDLAFRVRDDDRVTRDGGAADVPEAEDLTVRAARRLAAEAGIAAGVDIRVSKRLPAGGGLGGGSSDAATTLVALNRLWGLEWPLTRLAPLALALGADVPVFVGGRAAWAEGVGERLTPLTPDEPWFLVVDPGVRVATAEVFAAPELTRDTPRSRIRDLGAVGSRNDCEAVVRARYPAVAEALDWLSGYAEARLTGSGGCCFAAFADETAARAACDRVPSDWSAFVARGANRSPLVERLAREPAVAQPVTQS